MIGELPSQFLRGCRCCDSRLVQLDAGAYGVLANLSLKHMDIRPILAPFAPSASLRFYFFRAQSGIFAQFPNSLEFVPKSLDK